MSVAPALPDYGVFLRTPANGNDWIHPEDIAIVAHLIPSSRVFCRYRYVDGYYHFRYGDTQFRLRPCLWLPVVAEGLDVGDRVETIGVGMSQELLVSEVVGMFYDQRAGQIRYQLARTPTSSHLYESANLRLLSDKTKLRPGDTIHPEPRWNEAFRQSYPPGDYLHPPSDEEADQGTDKEADRDGDR